MILLFIFLLVRKNRIVGTKLNKKECKAENFKVKIAKTEIAKIAKRYFCEIPSRYNTMNKQKNTIELPVSFCNIIISTGVKIIRKSQNWSMVFLRFVWKSLMYLEIASATVILTNSLGWRLKPPRSYQDKAPLTLLPIINKPNKTTIDIR